MSRWKYELFSWTWMAGVVGTFVYLTFFDDFRYNAWNWLVVIPINGFFATIWPVYWAIIYPIFG